MGARHRWLGSVRVAEVCGQRPHESDGWVGGFPRKDAAAAQPCRYSSPRFRGGLADGSSPGAGYGSSDSGVLGLMPPGAPEHPLRSVSWSNGCGSRVWKPTHPPFRSVGLRPTPRLSEGSPGRSALSAHQPLGRAGFRRRGTGAGQPSAAPPAPGGVGAAPPRIRRVGGRVPPQGQHRRRAAASPAPPRRARCGYPPPPRSSTHRAQSARRVARPRSKPMRSP